jgi:hypothetical protein
MRLDRDMIASVFAAQGIGNHICLARMIMDFQLIIFDQFQPSSLPHVQVRLDEKILQTLMISVDMHQITKQIVPPNLQCKNDSQEL